MFTLTLRLSATSTNSTYLVSGKLRFRCLINRKRKSRHVTLQNQDTRQTMCSLRVHVLSILTRSSEVRDVPGSKGSWLCVDAASLTTPQVAGPDSMSFIRYRRCSLLVDCGTGSSPYVSFPRKITPLKISST